MKLNVMVCGMLFLGVILGGCNCRKKVARKMFSKDYSLLEIKGDIYGIDVNAVKNMQVANEAEKRMEAYKYVTGGRFKWDIANGKEIGISEDLFEYVLESWRRENRLVECGLYKIKKEKGRYILHPVKMSVGDTVNPPDAGNLEWRYGDISYKDSVFLFIEGDLLRQPQNIWDYYDIYVRAVNRLYQHAFPKNGYIKWNVTRGREIKISENIFFYITNEWRMDNQKIKTGKYELRRDLIGGGLFAVPKDEPIAPNNWERIQ